MASTISAKQIGEEYVRTFPGKYVKAQMSIPVGFNTIDKIYDDEYGWYESDKFGILHKIRKPSYANIVKWYGQTHDLSEDIVLNSKFIAELENFLSLMSRVRYRPVKLTDLPFSNGIFDMEKQELRLATPTDLVKKTFQREYRVPSQDDMNRTKNFLRELLEKPSAVNSLIKRLRQAVLSDIPLILVFCGENNTGKTKLINHIRQAFDLLFCHLPLEINQHEFDVYNRILLARCVENSDDVLTLISDIQEKLKTSKFRTILIETNNTRLSEFLRGNFSPEECEVFYFPNIFQPALRDVTRDLNPNALFSMVCGLPKSTNETSSGSSSGSSSCVIIGSHGGVTKLCTN